MSRLRTLLILFLGLLPFHLFLPCASAQVAGEFSELESRVALRPHDMTARRELAEAYAARGFVEESVAQYVAILGRRREDADAKAAVDALVARHMPAWLSPATAEVKPFRLSVLELQLAQPDQPHRTATFRLLVTGDFPAPEGSRRDQLHGWLFPRLAYGYAWNPAAERWELKVRVHHTGANDDLVQSTLQVALALRQVVATYLGFDPTRAWGLPIDIWLAEGGDPGGRTIGRAIYLYAIRTNRAPEEWLRELAHEYGHASLPGLGGFTKSDDPWADGEVGELLFTRWLAQSRNEWLPWSPAAAEASAQAERRRLLAAASGPPDPARLAGADAAARDYLVGLLLRIESTAGPRFLGDVLSRAPRARAPQVIAMAEKLAKERGVKLW